MIYDLSQPVFHNVPQWPKFDPSTMITGGGAEYLLSLDIHGVGIEGLSIGDFNDPEKETAMHKVLLGAKKLIIEDISIPKDMLDGRARRFAAFHVPSQGAGGAWTRAVAWNDEEMA